MTILRSVNGVPITQEELAKLEVHNDTIQAIYNSVNARIEQENKRISTKDIA